MASALNEDTCLIGGVTECSGIFPTYLQGSLL